MEGSCKLSSGSFFPRGWQECEPCFPVRYANTVCHCLRENCSICHSLFLKSFWLLTTLAVMTGHGQQNAYSFLSQGMEEQCSELDSEIGALLLQCCKPADIWKQGCPHILHDLWRNTVITSLVKQKITYLEASTCKSHGSWEWFFLCYLGRYCKTKQCLSPFLLRLNIPENRRVICYIMLFSIIMKYKMQAEFH